MHALRRPTAVTGSVPPPAGWALDTGYQQIVYSFIYKLAAHGLHISLIVNAGTDNGYKGPTLAKLLVTNEQGQPNTAPLTNCWISVGANGQHPLNFEATKEALARSVFGCYEAAINGAAVKNTAQWVLLGGAAWFACQVVPDAKVAQEYESHYLATPSRALFDRAPRRDRLLQPDRTDDGISVGALAQDHRLRADRERSGVCERGRVEL